MLITKGHILHPMSRTYITLDDKVYYSLFAAYHAYRTGHQDEFYKKGIRAAIKLSKKYESIDDWLHKRRALLHKLVTIMLQDNTSCRLALINTGNEELFVDLENAFLGVTDDNIGFNALGKIYMGLREVISWNIGRGDWSDIMGCVGIYRGEDYYDFDYGNVCRRYAESDILVGCIYGEIDPKDIPTMEVGDFEEVEYRRTKISDDALCEIVAKLDDVNTLVECLVCTLYQQGFKKTGEQLGVE